MSDETEVQIPLGTIEIDEKTFSNHRNVLSVTIPEGVQIISEKAFASCVHLRNLTLPSSIVSIGKYAFADCSELESITIPEGVRVIEEGVFSGCTGLQSVELPDSVVTINEKAFEACTGLKGIVLSSNIMSCSAKAFPGTGRILLTNKTYKDINGMVVNTANEMLLFYRGENEEALIPGEVKGIGDRAFFGSAVKSIKIPEGVISIGEEAFASCPNLEKLILPDSVANIATSAFDSNTKILCHHGSSPESWCMEAGFAKLK